MIAQQLCIKLKMSTTDFSSTLQRYHVSESNVLQPVSYIHVQDISRSCSLKWRSLPAYLEMKNPDTIVHDIERGGKPEDEMRAEFLSQWKREKGANANYKSLIKALLKIECRRDAEYVCELVQQQHRVSFPLKLTWKHGPDMPFAMNLYIQSVVLQGKLYAGGGLYDKQDLSHHNNYTVMEYNISSCQWSQLPQYNETSGFAMVAIKEQLVLVGGTKKGSQTKSRTTSPLGVWNGREWTHPYPNMLSTRRRCSAVVYNEWLVVAGGQSKSGPSTSVEVLNTDNYTWYTLSSTFIPQAPFIDMKTVVVGDTCYFMGGCIIDSSQSSDPVATNRMFSAHLPSLCPNTASNGKAWDEISGISNRSTPLSLGGFLLAVGGTESREAIHRYKDGTWEKVGNLPSPRFNCACALIGDREVAIVGGCDGRSKTKKLDTATIN